MTWPTPDHPAFSDFSSHQREEYGKATAKGGGNLRLITGRPGVGKSHCLARILKAIPTGRAAVCGPTGKSAVRITELMQKAGVNLRATTIHSLLGPSRDEDSGQWSFEHNEDNPLDLDWIFCDEFSMVDTSLAASLLAARDTGCRVLAIGDTNQLSPVGPGAPLRDLVAAGLPCGNLIEPQRSSGRIVRCCHGIIDKHTFEPSPKLDLTAESPENLLHIEKRDPEEQVNAIKMLLERFRGGATVSFRNSDGVVTQSRIDPVWQTQIIVPVNDKSPLARARLNTILQGFLNPGGETVQGCRFRKSDKVVLGKNSWCIVEMDRPRDLVGGPWNEDTKDGKVCTCNGDIGCVLAVLPRYSVVRLFAPDRLIRVPHGEQFTNEDGEETGDGNGWDLAYGISVHKSQGSEFPVAIFMVDEYPGARMLGTRELLYTAISRAKVLGITIGKRDLCDEMCRKTGVHSRKTFLVESIHGLQQASLVRSWESLLTDV